MSSDGNFNGYGKISLTIFFNWICYLSIGKDSSSPQRVKYHTINAMLPDARQTNDSSLSLPFKFESHTYTGFKCNHPCVYRLPSTKQCKAISRYSHVPWLSIDSEDKNKTHKYPSTDWPTVSAFAMYGKTQINPLWFKHRMCIFQDVIDHLRWCHHVKKIAIWGWQNQNHKKRGNVWKVAKCEKNSPKINFADY